jgi:PIN domain nuclease of toxin-antitoxin system
MRVLLDTHVAIWMVQGDPISKRARSAIETASEVVLSVVSPWEIVIKSAIGKIVLHHDISELTRELQDEFAATILGVRLEHVLSVGHLPRHHGDPFDRLLIAQAKTDGLTIITRDKSFAAYDVPVVRG